VARRRASGTGSVLTVGGSTVGTWSRLSGTLISSPALVSAPGSKTLELYKTGSNGKTYRQTRVGSREWSGWVALG